MVVIVPTKVARGIVTGHVTEERRPVYSEAPPVKVGQRIAIQTSATKPARCYVRITGLCQEPRARPDFAAVKACGFATADALMESWFDRFGKDSPKTAWVIDFRLDIEDDVHLLHRRSERGYTDRIAEAMSNEPESVPVGDLSSTWLEVSEARHSNARAQDPDYVQRVARVTGNRVREALIASARAGGDYVALAAKVELLL